jgi:2-polyprenyl-3-methyl-5-hydroxy-6-metoxy-1,4-benzoquinol methylase
MNRTATYARRAVGHLLRWAGLRAKIPTAESTPGLFLHHQVLPQTPRRPAGASETGHGGPSELFLKVAHAFEAPREARRESYRPIADLVRSGDRVLDIGCGDGTFLDLARQKGAVGTGVDLDPNCVAACEALGFQAHCVRVQDLSAVATERFDFVSMIHIIEHVNPGEALEMLEGLFGLLSAAGRIFIVTPNIAHSGVQTNFWLDITHVRPYPEPLLNSIVATLGFPFFQSGLMSFGTEAWCYAFRRPEHAIRTAVDPNRLLVPLRAGESGADPHGGAVPRSTRREMSDGDGRGR